MHCVHFPIILRRVSVYLMPEGISMNLGNFFFSINIYHKVKYKRKCIKFPKSTPFKLLTKLLGNILHSVKFTENVSTVREVTHFV